MISMEEAQIIMQKLFDLKKTVDQTEQKSDMVAYQKHRELCVEKFDYLIKMKTGRYKSFSNYEDLNQEGREALVKAMKTYNPQKGNFFAWAHNYIGTRISRSANLHTTIRFPLKVAKATTPHKESVMPTMIEERFCPDKELEDVQTVQAVQGAISALSSSQKEVIKLAFGFDGDKPMSINKICKKLSISRLSCIKMINGSLSLMKENIKI